MIALTITQLILFTMCIMAISYILGVHTERIVSGHYYRKQKIKDAQDKAVEVAKNLTRKP